MVKVPNGDISTPIKAVQKEINKINNLQKLQENEGTGVSLKDKARFMVVAHNLTKALEYYTKEWEKEIKKLPEFCEDFVDLGKKVELQLGSKITAVNSGIFDELSLEEIKQMATVSQKALKDANRLDLVEKFTETTGTKAPSVKIKNI